MFGFGKKRKLKFIKRHEKKQPTIENEFPKYGMIDDYCFMEISIPEGVKQPNVLDKIIVDCFDVDGFGCNKEIFINKIISVEPRILHGGVVNGVRMKLHYTFCNEVIIKY